PSRTMLPHCPKNRVPAGWRSSPLGRFGFSLSQQMSCTYLSGRVRLHACAALRRAEASSCASSPSRATNAWYESLDATVCQSDAACDQSVCSCDSSCFCASTASKNGRKSRSYCALHALASSSLSPEVVELCADWQSGLQHAAWNPE